MAEALYRKYRPQIFEDVVGQDHIARTIKNAITQDKVSHAYLFTGPRGTGKTTTARLLAKALLCGETPTPEPDGTCDNCLAIASGTHPDVYELDAASRTGVENVREEIIGRVQFAPTQGRYKVYIIDEVHMLSTAAFNALLKTLEEPPSHVVFILCTTDPQKVPETIHSRCQRFDFHRISAEAIVSRLGAICVAEEVEFEGEALDLIAHRAEGGMRNALTSLEQLIAFGEGKVTLKTAEELLGSLDSNDMAEIVGAIGRRDIASCFVWTANYVETGADLAQFVRDLSEHIRNMYILSLSEGDTALEISEVIRRELADELQYFGSDRLSRMLGVLGDLAAELRTSTNPRLSFEIALTRMVRPDSDITLEGLLERIEALEKGHSAAAPVISTATATAPSVVVSSPAAPPVQPTAAVLQANDSSLQESPMQPAPTSGSHAIQEEPSASYQETQASTSQQAAPEDVSAYANPAALQRLWQVALQGIKSEKAAYGVLFLNTKLFFDEKNEELSIEFPAENAFAYSAVQKPEIMDVVGAAIERAAGKRIAFRFTQASGQATTAAAPTPAPTPTQVPPIPQSPQEPAPSTPAVPQHVESAPVAAETTPAPAPGPKTASDLPSDSFSASHLAESSEPAPISSEFKGSESGSSQSEPQGKGAIDSGLDESDVQSILAQTYGAGITLDIVEE